MNARKSRLRFILSFFDELLLFSGQYALFYILMNFSMSGLTGYFANLGHTVLIAILVGQTVLLVLLGDRPLYRFLGSLLAPLCYTIFEAREGLYFLLNMGHMFFWFFSFVIGALQAFTLTAKHRRLKLTLEFLVTVANVLIFIFIYFYFDLTVTYNDLLATGQITDAIYRSSMQIGGLSSGMKQFLGDSVHIYILLGGALFAVSLAVGRVQIVRLKDRINDLFGTYVDGDIRDRIISSGGNVSERRELCILLSDIRNFTAASERNSSRDITDMLNRYFTAWDRVVTRHGGVIDKFIGDAILVIFGLEGDPAAADDAVSCALEFLEGLPALRSELTGKQLPVFDDIGIGVNFGEVIVGDIGSEKRKNFTVIGDSVNVTSRIEALCKRHRTRLIVAESVFERMTRVEMKNSFAFLTNAELRGKTEVVSLYHYVGDDQSEPGRAKTFVST